MSKFFKILIINIIVFGVIFIALNLFSPVIFQRFLSNPSASAFLPEAVRIFTQSSKSSLIPKNYVGIAGDSYAFGYGDWLADEMNTPNAKYSAAHILHDQLNVDVVSFGQVGAGSIRGIVGGVISTLEYLSQTWLYKTPDPDILLVFFYEGNDLSDNVEYVAAANKCLAPFAEEKKYSPEYFSSYIQLVGLEKDTLYIKAKNFRSVDNFFLVDAIKNVAGSMHLTKKSNDYYKCSPYAWLGRTTVDLNSKTNMAIINGQVMPIPDSLQGPSSDLTNEEIKFGLYSFEQSVIFSKNKFPNTQFGIVYIPSVLSSYEMASPVISTQPFLHKQNRQTTPAALSQRSDYIAQQIENIAAANDVAYIDARPYIRAAGKQQLIHGPKDWNHLNKKGYTALAEAVVNLVIQIQAAKNR